MTSITEYLIENNLKINEDLFFDKNIDGFVIYNLSQRTSVYLKNDLFEIIFINQDYKINTNKKYIYKDISEFTLWKNMYANPNLINLKKPLLSSNCFEIFRLLHKKKIFIDHKKTLHKKFLFEKFVGNINKQILTECFYKKKDISEWWIEQKFQKNSLKKIKDTPYSFIQKFFIKNYLKKIKDIKNKNALEVACGHGFYSNIFSKYFKNVSGFDYNESYIQLAKNLYKQKNLKFFTADLIKKDFTKEKYDFIFMIDVYLFFFDKEYQINLYENKVNILKNIYKSLNKNGRLVIIDPHNFWLMPRFGTENNPIGILNEYFDNKFSSLPPLEERLKPLFLSGFKIIDLQEPKIDNKAKTFISKFDFNFLQKFPQWICITLTK